MFEVFDHTADLGIRIRADTPEALFADAATALFSLIVANFDAVEPRETRFIRVAGEPDQAEYLLLDWLSELLYRFESEHLLLCRFDVQLGSDGLEATVEGEPFDGGRHQLDHEIKAITYHGLKLEPTASGWLAEVIVDI